MCFCSWAVIPPPFTGGHAYQRPSQGGACPGQGHCAHSWYPIPGAGFNKSQLVSEMQIGGGPKGWIQRVIKHELQKPRVCMS